MSYLSAHFFTIQLSQDKIILLILYYVCFELPFGRCSFLLFDLNFCVCLKTETKKVKSNDEWKYRREQQDADDVKEKWKNGAGKF